MIERIRANEARQQTFALMGIPNRIVCTVER